MPQATVSIYLPDEEYIKFLKKKEGIVAKVKALIKSEVEKPKQGG